MTITTDERQPDERQPEGKQADAKQTEEEQPSLKADLKDDYVLTRDAAASARLNLSHYIWLASFGFNLHPRISGSIGGRDNISVADIGAGTGIWLLDVATQLPASTQLDGIDISFGQCSPKPWLPKNVTLRLANVFDEVPDDLVEKYDIIHIRHFVCVVKGDDPMPLLYNLLRMLKPGGWLQWGEWDVLNRNFTKTHPDAPQENIDNLEAEFAVMRRHTAQPSWPPRLNEKFLEGNMTEILMEKRTSPLSHLPYMHDLTLLVFQELIDQAVVKNNIDDEKARHLRQLLNGATRESRAGAAWNLTRCMAVGRKAII